MGAQAFWVPGASQTLTKLKQSGCAQGLPMTHVMAKATGRHLKSDKGKPSFSLYPCRVSVDSSRIQSMYFN